MMFTCWCLPPRPAYKKLYENAKKYSEKWGPIKVALLADIWNRIELERAVYAGTNSTDVGRCVLLAQAQLAQSKRLFLDASRLRHKAMKLIGQISTSATDTKLLSRIDEAATEIMLDVLHVVCQVERCGWQLVCM